MDQASHETLLTQGLDSSPPSAQTCLDSLNQLADADSHHGEILAVTNPYYYLYNVYLGLNFN